MKTISFCVVLFLAINCCAPLNVLAHDGSPSCPSLNHVVSDSTMVPISQNDFKEKMAYYMDMMREEAVFSIEEYIEMVLIDNTYFMFMRNSNPQYKVHTHNQYLEFLEHYMPDILKKLEATEQGCNGGFYSAKYDLCVGGTDPNSRSVYQVQ